MTSLKSLLITGATLLALSGCGSTSVSMGDYSCTRQNYTLSIPSYKIELDDTYAFGYRVNSNNWEGVWINNIEHLQAMQELEACYEKIESLKE